MKTNSAMREALGKMRLGTELNPSLKCIPRGGFEQRDGCYFLRSLSTSTNVTRDSFADRTGYECFVNSLHVEDYDPLAPLSQAVLLVKEVFLAWNALQQSLKLTAILSADELSVVAKFHIRRPGEEWLSANIEAYEDPVLSIDSSEDVLAEVRTIR